MPIYEYQCDKCDVIEEKWLKVDQVLEDTKCTACGEGTFQRILSAGVFKFHGSGFHSNLPETLSRKGRRRTS